MENETQLKGGRGAGGGRGVREGFKDRNGAGACLQLE